jgi:hypothetical protein
MSASCRHVPTCRRHFQLRPARCVLDKGITSTTVLHLKSFALLVRGIIELTSMSQVVIIHVRPLLSCSQTIHQKQNENITHMRRNMWDHSNQSHTCWLHDVCVHISCYIVDFVELLNNSLSLSVIATVHAMEQGREIWQTPKRAKQSTPVEKKFSGRQWKSLDQQRKKSKTFAI